MIGYTNECWENLGNNMRRRYLVALSSIDINNYGRILQYKNNIDLSDPAESNSPPQPQETPAQIVETGERVVNKL